MRPAAQSDPRSASPSPRRLRGHRRDLALGSAGYEPELNAKGERLIWLETAVIDRTRRQAARTARGREDLVVWLKHLENRSRHSTERNDPVATYDFTWMWRDLNVDHLRN